MIGSIPFIIPSQYAAELASGAIVRFGTILKDAGTGHIVAHLQETGLAQQILGNIAAGPLNTVSALVSNYQIYGVGQQVAGVSNQVAAVSSQITGLTQLVSGLQLLQFATMGMVLVGIGVSAMGFKMVNTKLNKISEQIGDLSERVDRYYINSRKAAWREHYAILSALVEGAELAYSRKDRGRKWMDINDKLGDVSAYFREEARALLEEDFIDIELLIPIIHAWHSSDATRLTCLMLLNEKEHAADVSSIAATHFQNIFDRITPTGLAAKMLNNNMSQGSIAYQKQLVAKTKESKEYISAFRDMTDMMSTRPLLIQDLIKQGVNGYEYIQQIREEKERPLLLLPVA